MMKKFSAILRLMGAGVVGVMPFALSASAQTPTAPTTTTTTTTAAAAKKKPTSATPQMIDEAIQRSQARSAKAAQFGIPEQFGSEEPFVYVPGRTSP
jgi:hypothetical protein